MTNGDRPAHGVAIGRPGDAEAVALLHAGCFPRGWSADEMRIYLSDPAYRVLVARRPGSGDLAGFVIYRAGSGEAEILSLAVAPDARRQGIAGQLWRAARQDLLTCGVTRVVLEVGAFNRAARALYGGLGFAEVGRRPGYYQSAPGEPRQDGLIMACVLGRAGLGE